MIFLLSYEAGGPTIELTWYLASFKRIAKETYKPEQLSDKVIRHNRTTQKRTNL